MKEKDGCEDKDVLGDELEVDQMKEKDGCEGDEKPKTKVNAKNLRIIVLSYEESLKEKEACNKPFLGVDVNGSTITITYNE